MNKESDNPVCGWTWHDGQQFQYCPLTWPHEGRHARNDGTVPTAAEIQAMDQ